jgi:hypothetical protein
MPTVNLIRIAALAVVCLMLPVGCGSDKDDGPPTTTLDGERLPDSDPRVTTPTARPERRIIDVSDAPTEAHKALARLLPVEALVRDSVLYSAWDGQAADFSDADPARAPLPVVKAEYLAEEYRVVDGPEAQPRKEEGEAQLVHLILIRCPDDQAAEVVARNVRTKLDGQGFDEGEPLLLASGDQEEPRNIRRFVYVDEGEEADLVYVGYVNVLGDMVVYALERTRVKPLRGREGNRLELPGGHLSGRRVGAQLATLVMFHAESGR